MEHFLLRWHKYFYSIKEINDYKNTNKPMWILCEAMRRFTKWCFNKYLMLYAMMSKYPTTPLDPDGDIVVSLTSFPKRIHFVWKAIDSLFHQQVRPSKIYLYLSNEEFPLGKQTLPKRLLEYEKLGLEICFRPYNLMPHTKYFYALQEHKDKCVITIDDDIYYHDDLISNLLELHYKYPDTVCANKSRHILVEGIGFAKYIDWNFKNDNQNDVSHLNLAMGVSGVLYPPFDYKGTGMFNKEEIALLSLKADDLWLKVHEILGGYRVSTGSYYCAGLSISGANIISLQSTNVNRGQNDVQWQKLCQYYNINSSNLLD